MRDFYLEEGKWVDEIVRRQYPRWITWLAENGLKSVLLRIVLAKMSGLEVQRAQNTNLHALTPGFRTGKSGYTITSITTSILKRKVVIDKKTFNLNLHIPSDLDMNLFKK